jgi:hypothetical protein
MLMLCMLPVEFQDLVLVEFTMLKNDARYMMHHNANQCNAKYHHHRFVPL